ncbi:heterokaryon incompatibility protein-domain-containing protein [Lasiosphaeris hirsuta]|uniref:Heterokaryon incompatibility protein-domain-containing protein n=1 Tax=Lasiosphaeris hirsuta TaxID=260670 RepID=A0AA40E167_9PEZI|nr:heterokaryon incompatibility protein-domain-containing protein [Lasiosphaeris hirsuta]
MPRQGITPHLEPFLPYVEKAKPSKLQAAWHTPDSLLRPLDISTLKIWLDTCDKHHGDHCANSNTALVPSQRPAWLADVHRRCIVRAEPSFRYATLSYVWGKTSDCVALTTATKTDLLNHGSLIEANLPATICDAMRLVAALDLTYLWIDRLCIVQDDCQEKHAQIKAMGSIYAQSSFTLVAAQSDDASGPLSSRSLRHLSYPAIFGWAGDLMAIVAGAMTSWSRTTGSSRRPSTNNPNAPSPWDGPHTDREVMNHMAAELLRTVWFSRG